jgi:hypothetical protein
MVFDNLIGEQALRDAGKCHLSPKMGRRPRHNSNVL